MRKLPPLNSLRAFEAAARLGGVQKAADELCVTHGAVSRQIKRLEDYLCVQLFKRVGRSLTLTEAGLSYEQSIASAFTLIQESTLGLNRYNNPNTLVVAVTHSVATKWLMNKLPRFYEAHPEIEISLVLEQKISKFSESNIDIAIRMGKGSWPNLESVPLEKDKLIPVCSPDLIDKTIPLKRPEDVLKYTLLHDGDPNTQWSIWFETQGVVHSKLKKGLKFTSSDILLQAAINGQGIALANYVLAYEDLTQGRLIQPLTESVDLGIYYWLVMQKNKMSNPPVQIFCNWIKSQSLSLSVR